MQNVMFAHIHGWKGAKSRLIAVMPTNATTFVYLQPSINELYIGSVEGLPPAMKSKWAGKLPGI